MNFLEGLIMSKKQYDEKQIIERGKSFQYAFTGAIVVNIYTLFLHDALPIYRSKHHHLFIKRFCWDRFCQWCNLSDKYRFANRNIYAFNDH